jgi:glutaredoxin 3
MKKVIIYTTDTCPYCSRAKSLLEKKNIPYAEVNVSNDELLRDSMIAKAAGRRTVPQIFIGDYHVGGCDDLYEHESLGKLDELLK